MFTFLNISFIFLQKKFCKWFHKSCKSIHFPRSLETLVLQYYCFPNMATHFSVILGCGLTLTRCLCVRCEVCCPLGPPQPLGVGVGEVEGRSHCSVAAGLGEVVSTGDKLSLHASLIKSAWFWTGVKAYLVNFMEKLSNRHLFVTPRRERLIDGLIDYKESAHTLMEAVGLGTSLVGS